MIFQVGEARPRFLDLRVPPFPSPPFHNLSASHWFHNSAVFAAIFSKRCAASLSSMTAGAIVPTCVFVCVYVFVCVCVCMYAFMSVCAWFVRVFAR